MDAQRSPPTCSRRHIDPNPRPSHAPKDPSAYALAPPFWVTQADLYGLIVTYVTGRERNTRAHQDLTSRCWAMVSVYNPSKAVNIPIVEGHDAHHLLTPIQDLAMQTDEKDDFNKGFVFKHSTLDMANQGFATLDFNNTSTARTSQRAQLSNYLVFSMKFKFPKVVRILAICTKFVNAFIRKWRKTKTQDQEPPMFFNCLLSGQHNLMSTPFTAYTEFLAKPISIQYEVHSSYYRKFKVVCNKAEGTHQQCVGTNCQFLSAFRVDEVDIQLALFYLYTKAMAEVDKFCKPDKIQNEMFRLGGILFHKKGLPTEDGT